MDSVDHGVDTCEIKKKIITNIVFPQWTLKTQ